MIFEGTTGDRCVASSILTSRPSCATRMSSRRTTSTTLPSSRIRRVSRSVIALQSLAQVVGVGAGAARPGEAAAGTVEPEVDLAGADRVLVLAVLPARGGAVALAQGADHHEVVAEPGLGLVPVEIRHARQD